MQNKVTLLDGAKFVCSKTGKKLEIKKVTFKTVEYKAEEETVYKVAFLAALQNIKNKIWV